MKAQYKLAYAIAKVQAQVNWINEHWDYTFDENDLEQLNQAKAELDKLNRMARETGACYLVPTATSHLNHEYRVKRHQSGLLHTGIWYRILLMRRARGEHTGYWWKLPVGV